MGYQSRNKKSKADKKNSITILDVMAAMIVMAGYNGLDKEILSWDELPVESNYGYTEGHISCPDSVRSRESWELIYIWGVLVLLFGDYGTSPRYGWIDHPVEFKKFICQLKELSRHC